MLSKAFLQTDPAYVRLRGGRDKFSYRVDYLQL